MKFAQNAKNLQSMSNLINETHNTFDLTLINNLNID